MMKGTLEQDLFRGMWMKGNNIKCLKEAYVVRCSIQNSKGIGCDDARYHKFIIDICRYFQKN